MLNPPYLLFFPDKDRDDVVDADPEVHLAGFGLEDTHSVANSLRWGPDGWLYGAHGSTVTANIVGVARRKDGTEGRRHVTRGVDIRDLPPHVHAVIVELDGERVL